MSIITMRIALLLLPLILASSTALAAKKQSAPAPQAAPATPAAAAAPDTMAVRSIVLDPAKKAIHRLHLVPGVAATIQLPERWKETPICGQCVFGDAEYKGQLFRLDLVESTQTLTLKTARLPGPDAPPDAFITNLDISLAGGATVTFFVDITPYPEQADTRVEVTIPDGDKASRKQTAFDREMAQVFEARLTEAAAIEGMKAALYGTKCRDFAGGVRRSDNLVVRLGQLCRNGKLLWLTFEVENRSSEDLALATPTLSGANGIASTRSYFDKTSLLFNERSKGVVAADLIDPAIPPSTYAIEIVEDGGKNRTVSIDDINF